MHCHYDFYLAARLIQGEIYFFLFFSQSEILPLSPVLIQNGNAIDKRLTWYVIMQGANDGGCCANRSGGIRRASAIRSGNALRNGAARDSHLTFAHLSFPVVRALVTRLSALSRGLLFLAGSSLSSNGIIKPRPAVYSYRIASRIGLASIMSRGTGTIHVRADISLLL